MKKEKIKNKFQESKIYKAFRRLTSLGLAGALAVMFPNEIIAWLSAGAGILYGKGIIGFGLMSSIVTFLGSAAGILVQKIVLCGLTYLFSNIILKQGKRLISFIGRKIKLTKNAQTRKTELVKKIEPKKKEIEKEKTQVVPEIAKAKVKTLGVHPSMKK